MLGVPLDYIGTWRGQENDLSNLLKKILLAYYE
jgi:hypothetical protein